MNSLKELRRRAKRDPKRIVLPEGRDRRVIEAKGRIVKEKIAEIILIKRPEKIKDFDKLVGEFCRLRRKAGRAIKEKEAVELFLKNSVYTAAMMTRMGLADGFVAGASYRTSDVAKASLRCLNVEKKIGVMSGAFVIEVPDCKYGQKGDFIFSDCGIVPFPTAEQLTGIAISAALFAGKVLKVKPKIAMLSYSTKGSAGTPNLNSIREAVEKVKRRYPEIEIDGELQVDAALDPDAARIKHSVWGSSVSGKANVLIFPNLDSGNIAYKLIQRLAKARAVGPLLLGLEKPCSDLSRACSTDDIVDAVAITSVMAE